VQYSGKTLLLPAEEPKQLVLVPEQQLVPGRQAEFHSGCRTLSSGEPWYRIWYRTGSKEQEQVQPGLPEELAGPEQEGLSEDGLPGELTAPEQGGRTQRSS
jgi:hypothetical protein